MEKQKKFSLKNYLYEYKWWYVFGIAILLCVDLANIYIPQFIGDIIDGLTNETLTKAGIPMMLMKILIAGLIMMSVSYTHLDVYKRQVTGSPLLFGFQLFAIIWNPDCI